MNTVPFPFNAPACMGGFCLQRDRCMRHLTAVRLHVAERLCERGKEVPEPVFAPHPQMLVWHHRAVAPAAAQP